MSNLNQFKQILSLLESELNV